jgi:colanic acid biosynthesis glycosyl transferase WcaI
MNRNEPVRCIFVNRFFWPDHSATSQILSDIAFALAEHGMDVHVITSRLTYEGDSNHLPSAEAHRGVHIHRVWTSGFGRESLLGRASDYISFYIMAFLAALRLSKGGWLIIKTDPPLLSIPMRLVAWLTGARQINWLQDVYPELAMLLGVNATKGLLGNILLWLRNNSLAHSYTNVVIGEVMAERLEREGIPPDRIMVIHNWTDDISIAPDEGRGAELRRIWGFGKEDLVVGYSGNLGRAHDLETLVEAATLLEAQGDGRIRFLFIGGGHLRASLDQVIAERGLTNIHQQPYQPRELLPHSMAVPDVHWMSLKPELEGLIVPSKFYSAAASGRPIVFVGSPDGQLARMIAAADCGASFVIGDSVGLAELLHRWAYNTAERDILGSKSRALIAQHYTQRDSINRWLSLLLHVKI